MKILIPEQEIYIVDETPLPSDAVMETTWTAKKEKPSLRFGPADLWKIHRSRKYGRK